jgi:hypothetical protein
LLSSLLDLPEITLKVYTNSRKLWQIFF